MIDFSAWTVDPTAIRCILIDVNPVISGTPTSLLLSTKIFEGYEATVKAGSLQIVERMPINGKSSISFGDVSINNIDGDKDGWFDHVWSGTNIIARVGDIRWDKTDFVTILDGVVEDAFSSDPFTFNLKVRDKLQRLNAAVSEDKLGGATRNSDLIIPVGFGEIFNANPLLTNPATLEYQVHNGPIESIIEVRDNGVPVSFTATIATGKFTLNQQSFGRITCSYQGDKPSSWNLTTKEVIQRLAEGYGESGSQFTAGDLDATSLSAFDIANPQPIGVNIGSKRENLLNLIGKIADTVGAAPVMSRIGELQLIKIALPAAGTPVEIDVSDIVEDSLRIIQKIPVKASQKLGYNKNWTIQENLETGIPAEHKDIFGTEWLTSTDSDAAVKAAYKITSEPEQIDTFLITGTDADAEATRRLNLWKVPRFIYGFKGSARMIELNLGDPVTITHPRFGMSSGVSGMVVGLAINWNDFTVNVEVFA